MTNADGYYSEYQFILESKPIERRAVKQKLQKCRNDKNTDIVQEYENRAETKYPGKQKMQLLEISVSAARQQHGKQQKRQTNQRKSYRECKFSDFHSLIEHLAWI